MSFSINFCNTSEDKKICLPHTHVYLSLDEILNMAINPQLKAGKLPIPCSKRSCKTRVHPRCKKDFSKKYIKWIPLCLSA